MEHPGCPTLSWLPFFFFQPCVWQCKCNTATYWRAFEQDTVQQTVTADALNVEECMKLWVVVKRNSFSDDAVKMFLLSPCAQSAMCCISCSHTLSLLLCVLTLTPTATGAGPETLCGAELVDTLQFVCGERGFYFSKCTFLFIHKGWLYMSQSSPPPASS